MVIYTIVIAAVWQASGLVMALMLAGLRGIDEELWKAARIDGIPRWRVYAEHRAADAGAVVRHRLRAAVGRRVVKLYDAVVAMTQGGPGTASEVPAKFIMDYLFGRANIGLASAGVDRAAGDGAGAARAAGLRARARRRRVRACARRSAA